MTENNSNALPKLKAGDWVEVRSRDEVVATLDGNGCLENLPFMPEMFAFCGHRLRVYKRAHKTCDTVNDYKGRQMKDAVHLEGIRCDGQSHGGCEASCLIYWKTAWLRKCDQPPAKPRRNVPRAEETASYCTEAGVLAGTRRRSSRDVEPVYICQATQVPAATEPLPWWRWSQYVEDYTSGNVKLGRLFKSFLYMGYLHGFINTGIGIGALLKWIYDRLQSLRGGIPFPRRVGRLAAGTRTPTATLDLQPGEWVRVKSFDAIRSTCDEWNTNRGLKWDAEMVPYCGGTYRVLKRVTKIINEKTGKLQEMKTPCVILDSVICQARYSDCRLFCPRSIYPYWREIWLERIAADAATRNE